MTRIWQDFTDLINLNHPGIYNIKGDILPIQIIDNRKLSATENLWLKSLDNKLKLNGIRQIFTETYKQGIEARIEAYLDVISRANNKILREVLEMSNTTLSLEELLEEAGLIAKWEARAVEKKTIKIAQKMLANGFSVEQTANLSELDVTKVIELAQNL